MSNHNQKLEPTRFEPGLADPEGSVASPASSGEKLTASAAPANQRTVWYALAGLCVLAAMVFFWLPDTITPREIEASATPPTTAARQVERIEPSPWQDAQLAQQRKQAQDILAALLEQQFTLEELGVKQWATEAFAAAQALATQGDEEYRQQQFTAAAASYQLGLDAMLAISASTAQVFEQLLQQGQQALLEGQPEQAISAFTLALVMQPDSELAGHALQRAHNLAPVLALVARAGEQRETGELDAAADLLQQAVALDPEYAPAKAALITLRRDIERRNYNQAMTAGYQAMDQADFDSAEAHFLRAQRILPAAGETASALAQARAGRTGAQIASLAGSAAAAEKDEQWQRAASAYQSVLAIDSSVVVAQEGLARSQQRLAIDTQLQEIIAQPLRLADALVYAQSRDLFLQAADVATPGPRLREQMAQVRQVMQAAQTPVAVLLQSDAQTDVTVYKVAHLGSFRRQQLELKPGVYTAVGVRTGYRDVRREFTVDHNQPGAVIEVACTEPI